MVDPRDEVPPEERAERATEGRPGSDRRERPERAATERDRGDRPPIDRDRDRDRVDREDGLRQRLEALVPEIVKKTFAAGMGAVFSTEEGIRRLAKDINIPDVSGMAGGVAGYVASAADTTKDRVLEIVARETREFLQTMNFSEEIAKLLTTLSFEIKTEIRFIPNSEKYTGVEPDVKASARLRRADKDAKEPDGAERRRRFWRREDDPGDPDEGER